MLLFVDNLKIKLWYMNTKNVHWEPFSGEMLLMVYFSSVLQLSQNYVFFYQIDTHILLTRAKVKSLYIHVCICV